MYSVFWLSVWYILSLLFTIRDEITSVLVHLAEERKWLLHVATRWQSMTWSHAWNEAPKVLTEDVSAAKQQQRQQEDFT